MGGPSCAEDSDSFAGDSSGGVGESCATGQRVLGRPPSRGSASSWLRHGDDLAQQRRCRSRRRSRPPACTGIDPMHRVHIDPRRARRQNAADERLALSAVPESFATAFRLIVDADPALVRTVALSLAVSGSACLCAAAFGLARRRLARRRRAFRPAARPARARHAARLALGRRRARVYLLLSRSGPLGAWGILFTPAAMVIAQTDPRRCRSSPRWRARSSPTRCATAATSCARWARGRRRRAADAAARALGRGDAAAHRASAARSPRSAR